MKYSKRLVAVILSIMMLMTMVPAMAFADDMIDSPDPSEDIVTTEEASEEAALEETQAVQVEEPAVETSGEAAVEDSAESAAESTEDAAIEEPEESVEADFDEEEVDDAEYDEDAVFEGEASFSEGIDPDDIDADPEKLMENFFLSDKANASSGQAPKAPLSIKGDRLSGNNLKYYNLFKKLMTEVNAGKRTSTSTSIPVTTIMGKTTITAKSLGLSKLAYVKNGRLYLTSKAEKKIHAMMMPENWKSVYHSLLSDFSSESYWVDWYNKAYFYSINYYYEGNTKSITFKKSKSPVYYRLPVMPEFASTTYVVSTSKLKGANTAKANAKLVVQTFDNYAKENLVGEDPAYVDFFRLWYYLNVIAGATEYDYDAYEDSLSNSVYWRGPWSLISVFDDSTSTKAVCAGYARAYKYLCDLSTFRSSWIDCQIATGDVRTGSGTEGHMWNIVRMNDGLNYLVDPTWADNDVTGEVQAKWFLRGAPSGTADAFTIEGIYRAYDSWMKSAFAPAERLLSKKSDYQLTKDRAISLAAPKIKKLYKKKKSFKIKWTPVKASLGALYVDGYQIQYSTKKSMKGAKNVYVKGFAKSNKLIKKLKKNKKYYVRIRTYAKVGKRTFYSPWSAKKKVKTK